MRIEVWLNSSFSPVITEHLITSGGVGWGSQKWVLSVASPALTAPTALKDSCRSMVAPNCPRRDEGRRWGEKA